jgi:ATPase family associated with various cellular activities (AAA)
LGRAAQMSANDDLWRDIATYFREGAEYYRAENERRERYATTATQKALSANFGMQPSNAEVLAADEITSWTRRSVLRVVRLMAEEHGVEIQGSGGEGTKWIPFRLGETVEQVPTDATLAFPAGTLSASPLLIQLSKPNLGSQHLQVVYDKTDPDAARHATETLATIFGRAKGPDNPYRNRTVLATSAGEFEIVPGFPDRRSDLILSPQAWNAVDNIHRFLDKLPELSAAGLSQNRGLLMAGPPGTGKTALTRIIAAEFAGDTTAVLVDNGVSKHQLATLYRVVADLSPALVLLEDLDLIAGNRQQDKSALRELLTVLDGLMTTHKGVVTVASTNEIESIDAAAKRAARFDEILEVPYPDQKGRRQILDTYLRRLGVRSVVTTQVAKEIRDNLSGADLRLIVNEAALGDALTTQGLIETAGRIFPKTGGDHGVGAA